MPLDPSVPPKEDLHAAIVKFLENAQEQLSGAVGNGCAPNQEPSSGRALQHPNTTAGDSRDGAFKQLAQLAGNASCTGCSVLRRLAPYGLQVVVSAAAYSTGLGLFQLLGHSLRISCNTRVLSSCLGCLGVGVSSAFAGHMSRHVHRQLETEGLPGLVRVPPWHKWDPDEALLDAVVGITCFKLWRGQFRAIMPSNLFEPGAWAVHSIPVEGGIARSGERYATGTDRQQLQAFFKRDGCHHCGSKKGNVIGDHIPPTKIFNQLRAERQSTPPSDVSTPISKALSHVKQLLLGNSSSAAGGALRRQRFYPQCKDCCQLQSHALRHNKNPLMKHWLLWRLPPPAFMPGVVASLRPLKLSDVFSRPPPGGAPASQGSKGKSAVKGRSEQAGMRHSKEVTVAVQAGPPAAWHNALWWTSMALASVEPALASQQVWGDRQDDDNCDVGQNGGLLAWAKRMEEAPGMDMWTSLDTHEHSHKQRLMASGAAQHFMGLPTSQQHAGVLVEECEEECELHSSSASVHTATSQLPYAVTASGSSGDGSPKAQAEHSLSWPAPGPGTRHPSPNQEWHTVAPVEHGTYTVTPQPPPVSSLQPVWIGSQAQVVATSHVAKPDQQLVSNSSAALHIRTWQLPDQQVHSAPFTTAPSSAGTPTPSVPASPLAGALAALPQGTLQPHPYPGSGLRPLQQVQSIVSPTVPPQQFFWAASSTHSRATLKPHRYSDLVNTPPSNNPADSTTFSRDATPHSEMQHAGSQHQGWAQQATGLLNAAQPAMQGAATLAVAAVNGAASAMGAAVRATPSVPATAPSSSTSSPVSWPLPTVSVA